MSTMKKLIAFLLAITMVLSLAACGSDSAPASQPESAPAADEKVPEAPAVAVTDKGAITLAHWEQDIPEWWDFVYKNTGIKVEYELIATSEYAATMSNRVTNGDGPDIFFSRSKDLNHTYHDGGYVVDLGEHFGVDYCKQYLNDAALANNYAVFGDGNIFGVPEQVYYRDFIFYNADYLKEHNMELPTNVDEFLDLCQQVLDNGDVPFIESGEWAGHGNHYICAPETMLNDNEGPEWLDNMKTGENKVTDEAFKKALDYYMRSRKYASEDSPSLTHVEAWEMFAAGECVFFGGMSWMLNQNYNVVTPEFNVDVLHVFNYPGNEHRAGVNATSAMTFVNAASENKELALEYIDFFMTHLNDYVEITGRITPVIPDGRESTVVYAELLGKIGSGVLGTPFVPGDFPATWKNDYYSFMEGVSIGTKTVDDLPDLQAKLDAAIAG